MDISLVIFSIFSILYPYYPNTLPIISIISIIIILRMGGKNRKDAQYGEKIMIGVLTRIYGSDSKDEYDG